MRQRRVAARIWGEMKRSTHPVILLTLFILSLGSGRSSADSLKDVLDSKELSSMDRVTSSLKATRLKGQSPKKNPDDMSYAEEVFKSEAKLLLVWLTWQLEPKFNAVSEKEHYGKEIVSARGVYAGKESKKQYSLDILLPLPKSLEARRMGLMPEFTQLRPPYISAVGSEAISLKSVKGILYQKSDQSCSLLIDIELGGVINIQSSECKDISELVALAETLDIARLNRKLLA